MADEAGFLELLVANERVGRWVDILKDESQQSRHKYAITQLQQDLEKGTAYVEEAVQMGTTQVLHHLLSLPSATELKACANTMKQVSLILEVCSAPTACGGKVCSFQYGSITVHIREGALGDGVGAKVWSVCHMMCRELLAYPQIYEGQQVLELGSGTGLVGLLAALAGAQQVVLTDYEDQVLLNLRTCMHMNTQAVVAAAAATAAQQQQQQQQVPHSSNLDELFGDGNGGGGTRGDEQAAQPAGGSTWQHVPDDAELFDDADSVDDLDLSALVLEDGQADAASSVVHPQAAAAAAAASQLTAWDADNMCVRWLDWTQSADALAAATAAGEDSNCASATATAAAADTDDCSRNNAATSSRSSSSSSSSAPGVPLDQQFPVILGNEVMYEAAHARLVAAAIKHRLQQGGRALLCCAVRDQQVFDQFRESCRHWGLRFRALQVQASRQEDLGGINGRDRDYEGGYLLMAVDHDAAPARDWHRDDFGGLMQENG